MASKIIVLLTDFGDKDPYLGIMKGVISQIAPEVKLIDLVHKIQPGDIQEAAFQLWQAAPFFPPGTIFLTVVDPGVGTHRKGLYFQGGSQIFIGPDNGLFTYLTYKTSTAAWELSNPEFQLPDPSKTFHGRDIFAPAAAYAATGTAGDQFGERVPAPIRLPEPLCYFDKDQLKGEVISIDRFGNLITSLGQFKDKGEALEFSSWIGNSQMEFNSNAELVIDQAVSPLPLVSTFEDIRSASCAGLIGSSGMLEIAAHQSSAADLLDLNKGDQVSLVF